MSSIYGNEEKETFSGLIPQETLRDYAFILTGVRLSVRNISMWKVSMPWQVPKRQINDTLIWLVREGNFNASVSDTSCSLSAGMGVIVPENTPHSFDFAPGCGQGKVFVIHADVFPYSGRSFAEMFNSFSFKLNDLSRFIPQLERAIALRSLNPETSFFYARSPVQELLLECAGKGMFHTTPGKVVDERIRSALEFFRNNYMNNISIADAAEESGLKEVQFRNLFRRYSGISPAAYLKNLRMHHAAELLAGTPAPIKDVARESGFNSESYFCLAFRKYYGIPPEIYRKNSVNL